MSKMIKKTIISLLAVCVMFTSITALCLFNVKADDTIANTVKSSNYGLLDGAAVRIPTAEDDKHGFGLRYTVAIPDGNYQTLKNLGADVKFGLLITAYNSYKSAQLYDEYGNLNTDNFDFISINETDYVDTANPNVVQVEMSELIKYEGSEDADLIGKYYYNVSLSKITDVEKQFIAIAYVNYKDPANDGAESLYFRTPNEPKNVRSMAYIAQKAIEDPVDIAKIGDKMDAFKDSYINPVEEEVTFKFNYSYDGASSYTETKDFTLKLGDYSKSALLEELEGEALIDAEKFDAPQITNSIKVWANGFNEDGFVADAKNIVNVNVNVKEADDYAGVYGYFATNGNSDVEFRSDNKVVFADDEDEIGNYKLYMDNIVVLSVGGNSYLGKLENGKLSITIGEKDYAYTEQVELPSSVYSALAGSYVLDGKNLTLNTDGTAVYNGVTAKYILTYDEVNEKLAIIIATENAIIKQVNKSNGLYSIDGAVKPGDKEQYEAVAGTYSCDAGDLSGEFITFNANGKITKAVNNATTEIGSFIVGADGATVSAIINDIPLNGTFVKNANEKSITLTGDSEYAFTCTVLTGSGYELMASVDGVAYSNKTYGYFMHNYTVKDQKYVYNNIEHEDDSYPSEYSDYYLIEGVYSFYKNDYEAKYPFVFKLNNITDDFGTMDIIRFSRDGNFTKQNNCKGYFGVIDGTRWIYSDTGLYVGYQDVMVDRSLISSLSDTEKTNYVNTIKNVALSKIADYEAGVNNGYVESGDGEQSVDIYQEIAGTYLPGYSYDGTTEVWKWGKYNLSAEIYPEGHEYAGKHKITNFVVSGEGWYELEPITENFGIIRAQTSYTGAWYNGDRGYREGWYAKVNGEYVLRISACNGDGKYWHPNDYVKAGSTFSSWGLFDELAGNAKETGSATYKIYTDASGATLKLENPGDMKDAGAGFELLLNGAQTPVEGSYDFIALGSTYGKFLVHFGYKNKAGHNGYDKDDDGKLLADNYTMGDYKKYGDGWLVTFEYKGVIYNFAIDLNSTINSVLVGEYVGISGALNISDISDMSILSVSEGTFKANGVQYKYVINNSNTIITTKDANGKDVVFFK